MKNIVFTIMLLITGLAEGQIINFSDPNLKAKLLSANVATDIFGDTFQIDANGNGEIEVSEALVVPNLNLSSGNISSLNGIQSFTNLQSLICNDNTLTNVDLSGMTTLLAFSARNNQLTSLTLGALPNFYHLDVSTNQLATLDVSGIPALQWLVCRENLLTTLDVSNHTSVFNIECNNNQLTNLNVSGCSALRNLYCHYNSLPSINLNGLSQLRILYAQYNQLSQVNLTGLTNLELLWVYNNNAISSLDLTQVPNLKDLNCSFNAIPTLDVTSCPLMENFGCNNNNMTSLNVTGLSNMVNFSCANNNLTTLNLDNLTTLRFFNCDYNQITALDTTDLTSIYSFGCSHNDISALTFNNHNILTYLNCDSNQITSLNVTNCAELSQINAGTNLLSSINLSNVPVLALLILNNNSFANLDVTAISSLGALNCFNNVLNTLVVNGMPELVSINCDNNLLTSLEVSNLPKLEFLTCKNNLMTTLDLSASSRFCALYCDNNPNLQTVFMKNGSTQCSLSNSNTFLNSPNLQYVCTDEFKISSLNDYFTANSMNVVVNTYCSFSPGGNYNTIAGAITYDFNTNGCDSNDWLEPNIRIDIDDQTTMGATFSNTEGAYGFYTQAGTFDISLNIENPSFFNISPPNSTINFPDVNNNTATQNFCIAPNGIHPDLEVVISPITFARPGFDAIYKVVYKNKGNIAISGNVTLSFDDSRLDLVEAVPAADNSITDNLTWNYSNLKPFESRSVEIRFNANTPTEVPALNNGDILTFTAVIAPISGDELPADNTFVYHQTVVGSYDPNDITCIEGETVSPTEIGNYLHYAVNFENTGTYQAENIVVRNTIDTNKYDINSLQVLSTSHNAYTRISGNVVEFIFEHINLAAVSGNPPIGGHGDVLFKIRTKEDLQTNDSVLQRAGIYFDYNAPIQTNDAETTFVLLNNPIIEFDNSVRIYPNPTTSILNIESDFNIQSIELYDVQGRVLETILETATTSILDISNKSKGIYFLKIKTEKGSKVEKIVKE